MAFFVVYDAVAELRCSLLYYGRKGGVEKFNHRDTLNVNHCVTRVHGTGSTRYYSVSTQVPCGSTMVYTHPTTLLSNISLYTNVKIHRYHTFLHSCSIDRCLALLNVRTFPPIHELNWAILIFYHPKIPPTPFSTDVGFVQCLV